MKLDPETIVRGLNEQQKLAVRAADGPVLIIAGAGSGKTKTLTHKVAYLIASGIPAHAIVALTFTNKAADEMKRRVLKLIGAKDTTGTLPFVGTFHRFALAVLRRYGRRLGYAAPISVFDETESLSLMRRVLETLQQNPRDDSAAAVLRAISRVKNSKDIVEKGAGAVPDRLHEAYGAYETALKRHNAVDFDDIILKALELVQKFPDVRTALQRNLTHFLIDEFQDTNTPQYALVRELARAHNNICVVGDDWQSIYSFRCADFTHLLRFEQEWPGTRVFFLEQNYRSTQTILDASHGVISQNQYRTEKKLFTQNPAGGRIMVARLADERMEAWWIMERIKEKIAQGHTLADCAVLFRTNVQSRVFEELCMEQHIPYQLIGAFRFYQRREIQDVVAYLKCTANPHDTVSLERIVNVPKRGLGQAAMKALKDSDWNLEAVTKTLGAKQRYAMREFLENLAIFRGISQSAPLSELIETVVGRIGYKQHCDPDTEEGNQRWENVQELVGLAREFDADPAPQGLERFLENIQLVQDADAYQETTNVLTLMTLHSAKGLEFPVVFVAGLEENILPHERSLRSQSDIEEERRLLYVGMTRAKQDLCLTSAHHRFLHGEYAMNAPSRFLDDIPQDLVSFIDQTLGAGLTENENTIYL